MASVNLFRGGTPEFKPMFCRGEYAQWGPPFSAPHYDDTPPYDSHADAAYGQGWLMLSFPLAPTLWGNYSHHWQQTALRSVKAIGDRIWLNWVPLRSFAVAQHIEVNKIDPALEGVTVKPVAARVSWDWDAEEWKWEDNTDYAAKVTEAGVSEMGLGEFSESLQRYAFINLMPDKDKPIPCTFGHNLVSFDENGVPTGPLDEYYGGVVLGLEIVRGDAEKLALLHRGNYALYTSTKICAFECSIQVG